jgi:hypothetical protein
MLLVQTAHQSNAVTKGGKPGFVEFILNNIWIDGFQIFDILPENVNFCNFLA